MITPMLIAHPFVDLVFPKAAPWLAKALGKHTSMTIPRLLRMCSAREAFLFVDDPQEPQNAMVAQFDKWGGDDVLVVLAMGGKGGENWAQVFQSVKDFAKAYGAKAVSFEGRMGWQRALPEARVIRQTYRIEIGD